MTASIDSNLKNTEARHGKLGRITLSNKLRYNGAAPIDVSSGDQVRHRLSRSGNRRINHPLHMMAVTQIRYPRHRRPPLLRAKHTEGKTLKEALRCLKRQLSDQVYR
jgi:transposase